MKININKDIAIRKLTSLLEWSDRLGSDETHEISLIIKILQEK
jgi:hypothetical protein